MGLGADGVDAAVRPAAIGHLHQRVVDVDCSSKLMVSRLAMLCGHVQPLGHVVDRDDAAGAQHPGALDRELADRAAAPDRDRIARLDLGIFGRHVAGREDVGQEQHLLVGQLVRHLDRADVGVGHAQVLGLAAGDSRPSMCE